MDDIIKLIQELMSKKPAPKGGIADTVAGVEFIGKRLSKEQVGDFTIIGSKLTDASRFRPFDVRNVGRDRRYMYMKEYSDELQSNFEKTLRFIKENPDIRLTQAQKDNVFYNLGVYRRVNAETKKLEKGYIDEGKNPEEIYKKTDDERPLEELPFVKVLEKTNKTIEEFQKKVKETEDIFKPPSAEELSAGQIRYNKLYNGPGYERGNSSLYRGYGSSFLPRLHEKGIIKLDDEIYQNLKQGKHHWGGADFFAPDPIRIWRKHFGDDVFEKLDNFDPDNEDIFQWASRNNVQPTNRTGPKNALEYMNATEITQRLTDEVELLNKYKDPSSAGENAKFYYADKPDQRMERITYHGENIQGYETALQKMDPEAYDSYAAEFRQATNDANVIPFNKEDFAEGGVVGLRKNFKDGGRTNFFKGAQADTKKGKSMSPGTSARGVSGGSTNREKGIMSRGQGPRGTTKSITTLDSRDTNTSNNKEGVTLKEIQKTAPILVPETGVIEKQLEKRLKSLIPADLNKNEEALFLMNLKEKYFPTKRINDPFFRNTQIKDKEVNLLDTNLLDFKLKHPNISIENEQGFIDRDKLKTVIDNAQIVGNTSLLNDTLQLSRNLDTMGSGITEINYTPNEYLNLTSSNVEDRNYDITGKLPIGPFDLSTQLNYMDNELLNKTDRINYDQNGVKGSYVANNDSVKRNLDLDKNYNIGNFEFGLKGGYDDVKYDDGYSRYSANLTPEISYSNNIGDGIFKTSVAKEILDGGQVPNLSFSGSYPIMGGELKGNFTNVLSDDMGSTIEYDYSKGLPGSNNYLEFKARTDPFNLRDSALFFGLRKEI